MRAAATKAGDVEGMSLWAGQGAAMARTMPARELVARLVAETDAALAAARSAA
ncbi:MAG: nitronate monooxygenase [Burkholderiales bacterium]